MTSHYYIQLFGRTARALQEKVGSRISYARREVEAKGSADPLTEREIDFVTARDSFYIASITETGWPYMQHRGGPPGFVKHVWSNRLAFADYGGNRQYITAANLMQNDRVSLFFMDYANRRRLKVIGHATVTDPADFLPLFGDDEKRRVERVMLIDVVGYDWNCPQHITKRFTLSEFNQMQQISPNPKGK